MSLAPQLARTCTPQADRPDILLERVEGEWREVPRRENFPGLLTSALAHALNGFAVQQGLGLAMGEVLFRVAPDGPARRPGVAYVARDRWTYTGTMEHDPAAFELVPNLAAEVTNLTTTADEIRDKVHDYLSHGVQLVWVIYPRHRIVYVHEKPEHIRVLSESHDLEGGTVLPGFRLPLTTLFSVNRLP